MSLDFAHGAIQWNAADGVGIEYVVSGLSFQPKAIRFYSMGLGSATDAASETTHMRAGVGFAVSTTERRCIAVVEVDALGTSICGAVYANDAVAYATTIANPPVVNGILDITAIASDGFTLTVDDAAPTNVTIFWEAWGGSDISVAKVVDIAEPSATGDVDYTVTGFVAGATDQVVMFAGCQSTAAAGTAAETDSGLMVGFASSGAAADNCVAVVNGDDGSASMDTDRYALDGECLAMIVVGGGNPDARAQLTQFGTDNFRLNWIARALTDRRYIGLAIKGGQWKAGGYTIDALTAGNTASVSGLAFQPTGVSLLSGLGAENTAGTAVATSMLALGSASSTTSRRSMVLHSEDAGTNAEMNLAIEYDQALIGVSNVGALAGAFDLSAINSDGFTTIVDAVSNNAAEWQGYLTFSSAAAGPVEHATSGALAGSASVLAGAAVHNVPHATSGELAVQGATIAGAAARTREHETSGVIAGGDAVIAGAAAHNVPHATSGDIATPGATLTGEAARTRQHATSGDVAAPGATSSGAAARMREHATSGAIDPAGSVINGAAARMRQHETSGDVAASGAVLEGSAERVGPAGTHPTSGALTAGGAQLVGAASRTPLHATSGAIAAPGATVAGAAARMRQHATTGALEAQGATVVGSSRHNTPHPTAGALLAQGAIVVGAARLATHSTSGTLVGGGAQIVGQAHGTVHEVEPESFGLVPMAELRVRAHHHTYGQLKGVGAKMRGMADVVRTSQNPLALLLIAG